MFDIFASVQTLVKFKKTTIDNWLFTLHSKVTVIILSACAILTTCRQYIGDPIDCIVDEIPMNVMDTYCWIHSTFTVPNRLRGRIGQDLAHPGVVSYSEDQDEVKYHQYYQWVCFVLFFQAILFYVPRYLWKIFEGGRIRTLIVDLDSPVLDEDIQNTRIGLLTNYISRIKGKNNLYFCKFFVCELLIIVNVIVQMFMMDDFLDGEFFSYGFDLLKNKVLEENQQIDVMASVFPKVTKCSFQKYGPSGTLQRFDGLCVLPVNIVNEKIYIGLWFWFGFLTIVTGLFFIWRMYTLVNSGYRHNLLKKNCLNSDLENFECKNYGIGDWFILDRISANVDSVIFEKIMKRLGNK